VYVIHDNPLRHWTLRATCYNLTLFEMAKHTILCVDDEIDNVEALERLFRKKYQVLKATSGEQALQLLDQNPAPVTLVITDQRMPEMTGVEFLEKSLKKYPDTIRILLTGYTDLESVIEAVNKGQIYRYLTKPWDPVDLSNTVDHAIDRYVVGQELKQKHRELEMALQELQTLDKAKNNFMILINHELKTPLTSMINFLSLLIETKLDEDQHLYVDRIQQNAERLKSLVDDVLLLVRAELNQLSIEHRSYLVHSFLPDLKLDTKELLMKKQQVVRENFVAHTLKADGRLVGVAMDRLVNNAAKFGAEKSDIMIDGQMAGNKYRLSVTNKGSSISSEVIDKIFKPFFIDEEIMNHSKGLGLGLSVAQAILRKHDSGLNIRNNSDGVTVYFDI
jgi:two-component system sensor histidine kinase/response regulator